MVLLDFSLYFFVVFPGFVEQHPHKFFSSSRGLKQEDLLSPLLFVIVMEALGRMISAAVIGGLLSGLIVGTWIDISHLLFVDDTFLIFCGADPNHLHGLGKEFKYHLVSWSKVCSLISEGGLGLGNLLMFNRALLGKRLWRYALERKAW